MDDERPPPLVPAEVDIRGFSGFILDAQRLLASELVALGTPEECWCALMLLCRAWQQSPPASLPNDARILASFSRAGRRWHKVRAMAMRGFILCSDGRWYHPVLAEQALAAWAKRLNYRKDQARLRAWRQERKAPQRGGGNGFGNGVETRFNGVSEGVSEPVIGKVQYREESTPLCVPPRDAGGKSPAPLAEEWTPRDAGFRFAQAHGLDPNAVLVQFRDYWRSQAGARARSPDWDAAWRAWVRREAQRRQDRRPSDRLAATRGWRQ